MSTFLVPPDQVDNFLDGFKKQFAIMRKQPGLISAQLHRGIAGSSLFMNYIVWESVDAFRHGRWTPSGMDTSCRNSRLSKSNIHPAPSSRPVSFRGLP
jgi:heme-degrading monooxygenase HmoA